MAGTVKAIPDGYHSVTPYLIVDRGREALAYYQRAFGAKERMRLDAPGGKIGHAEIEIGNSCVMLADEDPGMGSRGARALGGSPITIHLYVEDVDAVVRQALAAGGSEVRPVKDQFYGDRSGTIEDPFGHLWHVATHTEELSPEELERRAAEAMRGSS